MTSKQTNCQFREELTDINWKCQSCDLNLCDICNTKIHTKSEKLSKHNVVLLQNVENVEELEKQGKLDLTEIACMKHMDQKFERYCINCDKPLCSSCLIRPFQYEELKKVYEEKCILLEDLKRKIDECYPFFEKKAAKFRKMDDGEVTKHNDIKEKICNRKSVIKDAVTKESLNLIGVMEGIWDTEKNPLLTERERLSQIEQELKTRKNTLHEVLEKKDPASVFSTVEQIRRDIPKILYSKIQPPELVYLEPKEKNMKEVLGSVIRIPEISLIHTFDVLFCEISGLVSLTDDICVMYSNKCSQFKYFTISGSKFVTTKDIVDADRKGTHNFEKVSDITNYNGEILLSDMRLLNNTGTFEKLSLPFIRDKLRCTGIHSSKYNEVIVGFTNYWGSAGILELSNIGCRYGIREKMRRVECDTKSDKVLFDCPEKIATNINGYICVIDRINSEKARVVVIGKWGKPKWTYTGHPSINSESDFFPNDIITSLSGLVLVAEKDKNAIHVLSKEGQFICNCISDSEITDPVSICFDKKGQLMIGCSYSGKTRLHIVKFTD
ncbi:uncharacterized protein LOC127698870 [Mytilus californianus]|uniref:uncharacterized protein LOC127698870 n=1 Tax=Mytilus californianus TaxID=6549 RepID=UPI0022464D7A|nr:uncharacterized protein LOC127698870 [Mytilus californianus]